MLINKKEVSNEKSLGASFYFWGKNGLDCRTCSNLSEGILDDCMTSSNVSKVFSGGFGTEKG